MSWSRARSLIRFGVLPFVLSCGMAGPAWSAGVDCDPQTQLDVSTIAPQVILLDEVHGNVEKPAFTRGLICSLLQGGRSVILGIEHPADEQVGLNRYIESEGRVQDREELLQAKLWNGKCQDGRTSAAMLELIDHVRRLRKSGARVGILAIDLAEGLKVPMTDAEKARLGPEDNVIVSRLYDRAMADTILFNAVLYRGYTLVVLTGHAYTDKGYPGDPAFVPMGALLGEQMPVFYVGFESPGGTSWRAGSQGCNVKTIAAGKLFRETSRIDAVVKLDSLTASPPAVRSAP